MNNDLKIVSTECGDWYGIYVNGMLEGEGYSIGNKDWARLINKYKNFSGNVEFIEISVEVIDITSFPQLFDNLPKDFLKTTFKVVE